MDIKRANMNDAAGIARVHIDTWKSCYRGIVPDSYLDNLDYEQKAQGWESGLRDESQLNFVAVDKGKIIGWVTHGVNRDKRPANILEIYGIYVLPEYWDRKVGLTLFRSAMQDLEGRKPKLISLWVLENNLRAIKFYEANGFKCDGMSELINIGGSNLTELRYEKVYS